MSNRIPCPGCGHTQTVEMLRWELMRLERLKQIKDKKQSGSIWASSGGLTGGGVKFGGGCAGGIATTTTSPWIYTSSHNTNSSNSSHSIIGGYTVRAPSYGGYLSAMNSAWAAQLTELSEEPGDEEFASTGPRYNGAECCTNCGMFYNPRVHAHTVDLLQQIEDAKAAVYSPLEQLAMAADDQDLDAQPQELEAPED